VDTQTHVTQIKLAEELVIPISTQNNINSKTKNKKTKKKKTTTTTTTTTTTQSIARWKQQTKQNNFFTTTLLRCFLQYYLVTWKTSEVGTTVYLSHKI
jgi:hypothetical protein